MSNLSNILAQFFCTSGKRKIHIVSIDCRVFQVSTHDHVDQLDDFPFRSTGITELHRSKSRFSTRLASGIFRTSTKDLGSTRSQISLSSVPGVLLDQAEFVHTRQDAPETDVLPVLEDFQLLRGIGENLICDEI